MLATCARPPGARTGATKARTWPAFARPGRAKAGVRVRALRANVVGEDLLRPELAPARAGAVSDQGELAVARQVAAATPARRGSQGAVPLPSEPPGRRYPPTRAGRSERPPRCRAASGGRPRPRPRGPAASGGVAWTSGHLLRTAASQRPRGPARPLPPRPAAGWRGGRARPGTHAPARPPPLARRAAGRDRPWRTSRPERREHPGPVRGRAPLPRRRASAPAHPGSGGAIGAGLCARGA